MARFIRNAIGVVFKPYETIRWITKNGSHTDLIYLAGLLAAYFATASLVKTAAFRPYLLTRQFIFLGSAAASSFLFTSMVLWLVARKLGGVGRYRIFVISWAYTLFPTISWFWSTSLLYLLLPPPRTTSFAGLTFSILYLVFSGTLLFWKIILAYLALRFSLKMDLKKIILTVFLATPAIFLYSFLMYELGIFKVPFI